MNAKPTLARPRFLTCFIAALLSAVISAGLLGAVSGLFQSAGIPFGKVVVAERPCRDHAFVSEREECIRSELAGPIRAVIASVPGGAHLGKDAAHEVGAKLLLDAAEKRVGLISFSAPLSCSESDLSTLSIRIERRSRGKRSSLCES